MRKMVNRLLQRGKHVKPSRGGQVRGCYRYVTVVGLLMLATASQVWGIEPLQPGETLNHENWQKAEGLLPPEILEHYRKGEYANPIALWEEGSVMWGPTFLAHTRENEKSLTLDENGAIIDKRTGKRPDYVHGFPFPRIDSQDQQVAIKILWNYFFGGWSLGNFHTTIQLNWLTPRGLDRSVIQEVYFLFYTGQPREYVPRSNPNDLYAQFLSTTVFPADLQGTAALGWRYRDTDKRDSLWVYVSALRRVRAVSPANRSDGFMGSDMSQDDGPPFEGKPEDFDGKLAGEAEVLRLVDPYSLRGDSTRLAPLPTGGWRIQFARVPMIGFHDRGWKGLTWAPVGFVLAKRRCWIIEGTPKDRYYLYGRIQLYIDKETYQGAYNRKFDWHGQLVNTYVVSAGVNRAAWGDELYGVGTFYQGAENVQLHRATVATVPQEIKDPAADWRIRLAPSFFDYQTLMRFGK